MQKIIKYFKRFVRYQIEALVCLFDYFVYIKSTNNTPSQEKKILIVRPDGMGDYILFRNFIAEIKQDEKYRDYSIHLLGAPFMKSLIENLDSDTIAHFIPVQIKKLWTSPSYRIDCLKTLRQEKYDLVFYPVYSRCFYIDRLIAHIPAKEKIAVKGNARNAFSPYWFMGNQVYHTLIEFPLKNYFEFDRNRQITSAFLNKSLEHVTLKLNANQGSTVSSKPYIVFFPDAAEAFRRWPVEAFEWLGNSIHKQTKQHIVITGNNTEALKHFSDQSVFIQKTNQTSLPELIAILSEASLLVSNDTGAVHLGAALQIPTLCLSNGNHYGRFVPYPQNYTVHTLFPDSFPLNLSQVELQKKYEYGSLEDIRGLKKEEVLKQCLALLSKNKPN